MHFSRCVRATRTNLTSRQPVKFIYTLVFRQRSMFAQVNSTKTSPHKKTMKRKAISQHRKLSADRVSKSQGCQNPKAVKFFETLVNQSFQKFLNRFGVKAV